MTNESKAERCEMDKWKWQATEEAAQLALSASPEWKSAGRIIRHLWGIFVLLPIILGILGAILINAAK